MMLEEIKNKFDNLVEKTKNKYERKTYKTFSTILEDLISRKITKTEIQSIEKKLGLIDLNSEEPQNRKYFKKALQEFKEDLRKDLGLIPKGYYTSFGLAIGLFVGVILGFAIENENPSMILSIGMLLGIVVGKFLDDKAAKGGRVLNV